MENPLIPMFTASANALQADQQLCNARDLHAALGVGRDFSNWIKDRIEQYGFSDGEDFILCSPNLASKRRGGHNRIEYHLTLDMAKELAMIENNEVGRQVRRYFIRAEAELRERMLADLRDRARHVLDLPGVKRFRRGISFKQTVVLQKQSRDLMQLLATEAWPPARLNLHRQLRQVNDALGIPTDPLDEIAGNLLTHRED